MTGPASNDAPAASTSAAVAAVRDALAAAGADAFVHAARADDPDLRYLLGSTPPDGPCAVVVDDDPVAFAPPPDRDGLAFDGAVRGVERVGAAAAARIDGADTVLAPRHLPHDVALRVEGTGADLVSTGALRDARARKTAAERERTAAVAAAAERGVERVRTRLAAATVDADGTLSLDGEALDADRLWRAAAAALGESVTAARLAGDAGAGPGATAVTSPDDPLRPGTPVVVTATPRGRDGYHAVLARTAAVDPEGGWERRAHVGVEAARRAALDAAEPGASVARIREDLAGELGAFGLSPPGDARLVHGVGLARHEAPRPSDADLEPGHVLVVAPAAADEGRRVALADTLVVTDAGIEVLTDAPTRLTVE
ncbi:MAG: M24 family metallopeptidase [Haloferacaceae archaeon]